MTTAAAAVERETFRARIYRRLADAHRPPAVSLSAWLNELDDLLHLLDSKAHASASAMRRTVEGLSDLHPLEVDFARLFAGPFLVLAPPYGSIYLEGERRIMGESTVDAQRHYRLSGFDIAENFKDAPDHISAELEFMHVLVCEEALAIRSGNRRLLLAALNRQRNFLIQHLGAWVPAFAEKITEHAQTEFYRQLAEATRRFIAEETEAFAASSLVKGTAGDRHMA